MYIIEKNWSQKITQRSLFAEIYLLAIFVMQPDQRFLIIAISNIILTQASVEVTGAGPYSMTFGRNLS